MKRIIPFLLFAANAAFGATLNPVQLLNPAGSTSGQAIVSTGPTTAPGWGNPTATLAAQAANTVVANATSSSHTPTAVSIPSCSTTNSALQYTSGTGFGCLTTSAVLGANTFTAAQSLTYSGNVTYNLNDTSGTGQTRVNFNSAGVLEWGFINTSGTGQLQFNRYVGGTLADTPWLISNSTGIVSMPDGLTAVGGINTSPIGNTTPASGAFTALSASSGLNSTAVGNTTASTGAFTTLSASGTVSGTGFSNYLASPPAIGGTTPAAGAFTTLNASGLITPSPSFGIAGVTNGSTAAAGSVGENAPATGSGVSLSNSTATNVTSISLAAGNWMVGGECYFIPAGSTSVLAIAAGASTTSATLPSAPLLSQIQASFVTGAQQSIVIPTQFFNLTTSTTVFMVAYSTFSVSTMAATCTIWKLRFH